MSKTNPRQIKIGLVEGEYTYGERRLLWMTLLATIACAEPTGAWTCWVQESGSSEQVINGLPDLQGPQNIEPMFSRLAVRLVLLWARWTSATEGGGFEDSRMTRGSRKIEVGPRAQIMLITVSLGFVKTKSYWRGRTATCKGRRGSGEQESKTRRVSKPCKSRARQML